MIAYLASRAILGQGPPEGGSHLTEASGRQRVRWQALLGIAMLVVAAGIALLLNGSVSRLAVFWVFGLGFGFIVQRSRFCFASAFRDLFLLRDGRVMKAILIGMAVATAGFAWVMYNLVPNLAPTNFPFNAYVMPLGFHTLLAGVLFGLGMVIAGGCFSGTFYRIGEGYLASVVALVGILAGMGLLLFNWNWWWQSYISFMPKIWLPHSLGWGGAILLTLAVLVIGYLLVRWWESRGGVIARRAVEKQPTATLGQKLGALRRAVLVKAWPISLAGVALGLLTTFEYLFERPWGLTGEVSRWSNSLLSLIRLPPPEPIAAAGPCAIGGGSSELLTWGLMINGGMIFGAFIGALLAGEFKIRRPRQGRRYAQSFVGGALMGYGAGLAAGCTIGAFFSSVPSLGLNGLVFGGALALGAFLGVKVIKKIS